MQQQMKLSCTPQEREQYDNLADLYSILIATETLERIYIRDKITAQEYTPACLKLIAQFKTIKNLLKDLDVDKFMTEYKISCPAAKKRLELGIPATVEHPQDSNKSGAKQVAETVQIFITLMDSLKLNLLAVDQLHPQLSDLIQSLHKVKAGDQVKIKEWLIHLNRMKASDELSQEDARQMLFDLESCYSDFQHSLVE